MNNMRKQRILLNVTARYLQQEPRKFNFIGLKNAKASYSNSGSLCPPPSNDSQTPCPPPKDPPPCPPPPPPCGPPCPQPPCVTVPDPNDPCNYVKPEDPDELDLTKLKKNQCLFQKDTDTPIFLRGGKRYVYYYHGVTILGGICLIQSIYSMYELIQMFK